VENWIQVWGGIVGAGERAPESREEGKKEKRAAREIQAWQECQKSKREESHRVAVKGG